MNELGVFCMNGQNLAMTSLSLSLGDAAAAILPESFVFFFLLVNFVCHCEPAPTSAP